MKFADYEDPFEGEGEEATFIAERLAAMGGQEVASLFWTSEEGHRRALVAADVALLDCAYGDAGGRPRFEVKVIPWDAVPVPWMVYAGFVSPAGVKIGASQATFTWQLDPSIDVTSTRQPDVKAATEFYTAALRLRKSA